jgi:hypothetical protein
MFNGTLRDSARYCSLLAHRCRSHRRSRRRTSRCQDRKRLRFRMLLKDQNRRWSIMCLRVRPLKLFMRSPNRWLISRCRSSRTRPARLSCRDRMWSEKDLARAGLIPPRLKSAVCSAGKETGARGWPRRRAVALNRSVPAEPMAVAATANATAATDGPSFLTQPQRAPTLRARFGGVAKW